MPLHEILLSGRLKHQEMLSQKLHTALDQLLKGGSLGPLRITQPEVAVTCDSLLTKWPALCVVRGMTAETVMPCNCRLSWYKCLHCRLAGMASLWGQTSCRSPHLFHPASRNSFDCSAGHLLPIAHVGHVCCLGKDG